MRGAQRDKIRRLLPVAVACAALLAVTSVSAAQDRPGPVATEGIAVGGSVSNSQITNIVNQQDPATLAALSKTFADQMAVSAEARAKAEAHAAELASKLGFTSSAVSEFFKILGEQNVPDEKIPTRLIEIATHFTQTQAELAALEPSDPRAAEWPPRRSKRSTRDG